MRSYLMTVLVFLAVAANAFADNITVLPSLAMGSLSTINDGAEHDDDISIIVQGSSDFSTAKIKYQCGDQNVIATYINANNVSLVQLDFADKTIVAANVLAASGAKYAGDQYYWWQHQNEVKLYNLIKDPEQNNPITCIEDSNEVTK